MGELQRLWGDGRTELFLGLSMVCSFCFLMGCAVNSRLLRESSNAIKPGIDPLLGSHHINQHLVFETSFKLSDLQFAILVSTLSTT
jgi:hypothetical protein